MQKLEAECIFQNALKVFSKFRNTFNMFSEAKTHSTCFQNTLNVFVSQHSYAECGRGHTEPYRASAAIEKNAN